MPKNSSITLTDVGYLPRTLTLGTDATVADLLDITAKVDALHAIEGGDAAVEHFDARGDDWDIETRADESLRPIGLGSVDRGRKVNELSGGPYSE